MDVIITRPISPSAAQHLIEKPLYLVLYNFLVGLVFGDVGCGDVCPSLNMMDGTAPVKLQTLSNNVFFPPQKSKASSKVIPV